MDIDYAFLCDAATEHGGKLNALGIGIDQLAAATMPATHPRLTFVARLRFTRDDDGERHFVVRAVDADGHEMGKVEGEMWVHFAPEDNQTGANLVVDLVNLEFTAAGPHEVTLTLDGEQAVMLPLEVSRAPQASQGAT